MDKDTIEGERVVWGSSSTLLPCIVEGDEGVTIWFGWIMTLFAAGSLLALLWIAVNAVIGAIA